MNQVALLQRIKELYQKKDINIIEYLKKQDGHAHNDEERILKPTACNGHIHSIETGNQRREHQYDGNRGHALHDSIQVVRNHSAQSFRRSGKDVAIDIHSIIGLSQFYSHIFHQLFVDPIFSRSPYFAQYGFIAANGSTEVNESLLKHHQVNEVFVANTAFEFSLGDGHLIVDLFQVLQEPHGRRIDES